MDDTDSAAAPRPLSWWRIVLGPALAAVVLAIAPGERPETARMAAIAVWMAAWWITEAVPIPVTALLPLVLLPAAGVMPVERVGPNYGRPTIFLFLGGFLLALGLEGSGAHRRLALFIVHTVGGSARRLVLGFMLATAFLSMWISNTATVMVLMPIGLAVLMAIKERGLPSERLRPIGVAVMLGIAYAADIGGMSTLVGTPPNLSYKAQLTQLFPGAPETSFAAWMAMVLPMSVIFLFVGWLLLTRVTFKLTSEPLLGSRDVVAGMRRELGRVSFDERAASGIFALAAVLWMTRTGVTLGGTHVPGWNEIIGFEKGFVDDAVVAVALAIVLFLIPSRSRPGETLVTWDLAARVPWGMLLLFGGGFALADGFGESGLSGWIGEQFTALEGAPPLVVIGVVCLVLTFTTELTSNTATTELVLPILAAAGVALGIDPRALMVPATLSASCAFMMPVASPTQAIVFSSGYVPIRDMVRAGLWFNFVGVALVTLTFALFGKLVMGIDMHALPEWAVR